MTRRAGRWVSLAACVSLCAAPVGVRAGTITGGATEWTQLTNMVQLIAHTVQFVRQVRGIKKQVEMMGKAGEVLGRPREFLNMMNQVGGLLGQMRGILYASESMVERWEKIHPGRKDFRDQGYKSSAKAYAAIDESTRKSVHRAMKVLDIQVSSKDGWPKDREVLKQLADKADSADAQLKCTQVTNLLLLEMIRQLHLLRGVQIAHAEMMGYSVAGVVQRRQYQEHQADRQLRRGTVDEEPVVDIARGGW